MKQFGLTDKQAEESRQKYGDNSMTEQASESFWDKLKGNLGDPMIKILIVALLINVVLAVLGGVGIIKEGAPEWYEPLGIFVAIALATLVSTFSEYRNENAFQKLQEEASRIMCKVYRNGEIAEVAINDIVVGDAILLQSGDKVPADGIIIDGDIKADQSVLNGESREAKKLAVPEGWKDTDESLNFDNEHKVFRGSVVCSGNAVMEVTVVGDKSVYGKIASELQTDDDRETPLKVKLGKLADGISKFGYIGGIAIAVAMLIKTLFMGEGGIEAFLFAEGVFQWAALLEAVIQSVMLAVIIIVMAVPEGLPLMIAIVSAQNMGKMLKDNVLVRKVAGIETAGSLNILFSDKTGTITSGEPRVTDILPAKGVSESELLTLAASLEQKSEHPLAKAVLAYAETETIACPDVTDFAALPGNGLSARLDGMEIYGGNAEFIAAKASVPAELQAEAARLAAEGKTPLFFGGAGRLMGVIAVADTLKEDSPRAIRELQNMGIRVVMLTGDNQRTADAIGRQAGVDEVIAGVLPDGKEAVIRRLQENGKVAMVGDGINDAPALTRADTGIAIGAGTDVAIDAADVVLMNSKLSDVPAAIRLSRATLRNIHENLFWAFIYNIIGIPLAAGLFIPFGLTLNPMFGAAAMSLSSFCVVSNALRLNLFDLHSTRHDHKTASPAAAPVQSAAENNKKSDAEAPEVKTEDHTMKKTLKVEGMMCGHCEARVKKALEALPEVDEAVVSHEAGTAVVTLSAEVSDDVLKKTVEDQDYKVTGIQ